MRLNISKHFNRVPLVLAGGFLIAANPAQAVMINGGFEDGANPPPNTFGLFPQASVPGWLTTATDGIIEIWNTPYDGVSAYEGQQFAELNANQVSTLYQDVSGIAPGLPVGFEFAHRGRLGVDTMRFTLTDLGADGALGGSGSAADTTLFSKSYSDGTNAWGFYNAALEGPIISLGNTVRFSYISESAAGGNNSIGNFLDAAQFGVGVGTQSVPEGGASLALLGMGLAGLACFRRKLA
jgi:VPDSG-CTERM motif